MNKRKMPPTCEHCEFCRYYGEGDFLCHREEDVIKVISNWNPVVFPNECGHYQEED